MNAMLNRENGGIDRGDWYRRVEVSFGQRLYDGTVNLHLVCYGPLLSSGNKAKPENKNAIRAAFAPQIQAQAIRNLMSVQVPLDGLSVVAVGKHRFLPLITKDLSLVVDIDALVLSPEPPTGARPDRGDVDGRTKTFMDALRIAKVDELKKWPVSDDPINCLLEDDSLVKDKHVRQGRLLAPFEDTRGVPLWQYRKDDTLLIIDVTVRATEVTDRNRGFLGIG